MMEIPEKRRATWQPLMAAFIIADEHMTAQEIQDLCFEKQGFRPEIKAIKEQMQNKRWAGKRKAAWEAILKAEIEGRNQLEVQSSRMRRRVLRQAIRRLKEKIDEDILEGRYSDLAPILKAYRDETKGTDVDSELLWQYMIHQTVACFPEVIPLKEVANEFSAEMGCKPIVALLTAESLLMTRRNAELVLTDGQISCIDPRTFEFSRKRREKKQEADDEDLDADDIR